MASHSFILATGGSGHGFKFFPIIGERIVDLLEDELDPELREIWRWRDDSEVDPLFDGCDDGSRSGPKGLLLSVMD